MASSSVAQVVKRLRFEAKPSTILFMLVPLIALLLFFAIPILSIVVYAPGYDWTIFFDERFLTVDLSEMVIVIQPEKQAGSLQPLNPADTLPSTTGSGSESDILGKIIGRAEEAAKASAMTTRIIIKGPDFGIIGNTVFNGVIVALATAVIGASVAIAVGLYEFPGRRLLAATASIPLLIAPFVNMYVIKRLVGVGAAAETNTISAVLQALGFNVSIGVTGLAGVTIAQIIAFYPIVYINALAALMAIDGSLLEQALNLGSKGFKLIRTVVVPLAMPGILAGTTLVYILSVEDVSAPIIFNFKRMISYQVYTFFQASAIAHAYATIAALSLLLLVLALAPLVYVRHYLSLRYYAQISRGAARPPPRLRPGALGKLVIYLALLPFTIAAAAPQVGVVVLAFSKRWTGALPELFTLDNFAALLAVPGITRGITNSIVYASIAALLIALLGFTAGYTIARIRLPGVTLLDLLSAAPLAVPGLVVAFSYYVYFTSLVPGFFASLSNISVALVIAYTIRKLPFTVRSVFTGVLQTPQSLEEAAESLGAKRAKIIGGIILPLTWRSLAAGLLLSTIYVLSEVSVSVTLGALGGDPLTSPNHVGPITLVILSLINYGLPIGGAEPQPVAGALATILMVLEALVIFVAASRLARRGQALITA